MVGLTRHQMTTRPTKTPLRSFSLRHGVITVPTDLSPSVRISPKPNDPGRPTYLHQLNHHHGSLTHGTYSFDKITRHSSS
jgi:hypothetical protein